MNSNSFKWNLFFFFFFFGRYFAQGNKQIHIANIYRLAKNECAIIIHEVSNAIIEVLKDEVMPMTQQNWIRVANEFNVKWQLPHCLGAIDGKHIAIRKPHNAGSQYYNYKRYHSIVLMATADANYKFISIDVGASGSEGDASIFNRIELGKMIKFDDPNLCLPPHASFGEKNLPHYFIADNAFPLLPRLMKPYSPKNKEPLTNEEEIFNYRLSRARRCVESAFGILGRKWACVEQTFFCQPIKVKPIIAACCLLHNFLINRSPGTYIPVDSEDRLDDNGQYVYGNWRRSTTRNRKCYR